MPRNDGYEEYGGGDQPITRRGEISDAMANARKYGGYCNEAGMRRRELAGPDTTGTLLPRLWVVRLNAGMVRVVEALNMNHAERLAARITKRSVLEVRPATIDDKCFYRHLEIPK